MTPQTEAELADIIRAANAPLSIRGGGTRPIGHRVDGETLSTSALTGVELYEPGALTLVVKAGTPVSAVEEELAKEGQRLAFEPMDHRGLLGTSGTPTIGGIVAANVSGPRRIQSGAARDFLLGVRFVDGQGQIIQNGGRVMKNVTGYDLVKLMAGSYGTLGVLTEVSLKVLPKPHTVGTLIYSGLSDEDAISALSQALASPFEVSGAAHKQGDEAGAAQTLIRLEGFENSVAYRAERLTDLLSAVGAPSLETGADRNAQLWNDVRDVAPFHDRPGNVWKISVKPTDAPKIVSSLPGCEALYDWGGGLIWVLAPAEAGMAGTSIRERIAPYGGHATLIRGEDADVFHPQPQPIAILEDGLRKKFDPKGILNTGLMGVAE